MYRGEKKQIITLSYMEERLSIKLVWGLVDEWSTIEREKKWNLKKDNSFIDQMGSGSKNRIILLLTFQILLRSSSGLYTYTLYSIPNF